MPDGLRSWLLRHLDAVADVQAQLATADVYKLGPKIPLSPSGLDRGCFWCEGDLTDAEMIMLVTSVDYAHGPTPSDCPERKGTD